MMKGNSPDSKNGWYRGVSEPGAFKLDHLQPVEPILLWKFSNFFTFILGANSYYPRRLIIRKEIFPNSKNWWYRGVSVPGAFKLDHLQPVEPILIWKFSNFFTFILGAQFLLPQKANNEKGEFSQLQKRMVRGGFCAWGIQTGPFAACWANFVLKFFQFFHFYPGRPIIITPERGWLKMGKWDSHNLSVREGF